MSDTWTVVGAGSALPRAGYGPSGHVLRLAPLEGVTLFDCGPGTVRALNACEVELRDVRRVVLSHFHVDHCADLAALAFARRNPAARACELTIYAPPAIDRVLAGLTSAFGRGAEFTDTRVVHLEHAAGERGLEFGGARLRWVPNGHTADALSFVVEQEGRRRVAYTGDTGVCDAFARAARDVALLVAECSFPDDAPVPKHLTPGTAGGLARDAAARRLLLTHFYPMLDPADARAAAARAYAGPIEVARDGSRHCL